MSSRILPLLTWRAALCESELAPTSRHVGLTLSLYMNERGESAFPGAVRLAKDTGYSERSVRDHLGVLVQAGWLELVERGGIRGERRRANSYRANVPLQHVQGSGSTPADDDTAPLQETASTPAGAAPHLFKNSPMNSRSEEVEDWHPVVEAEPEVAQSAIDEARALVGKGRSRTKASA